jgi:hypothetical protein
MADYQVPVPYSTLNANYQDNTTNSITARHGRQLVANASPFFFSMVFRNSTLQINPGQSAVITKQWCDDYGDDNVWVTNGFLSKQSDNAYILENVTGADLLVSATVALWVGNFSTPDHKFVFKVSQQEPGEPLRGFLGHGFSQSVWDGSSYFITIQDDVTRRIKAGSKIKMELTHSAGTGTAPFNCWFRFMLHAHGGWRGYSARYVESKNAERGQDVGGVKYE